MKLQRELLVAPLDGVLAALLVADAENVVVVLAPVDALDEGPLLRRPLRANKTDEQKTNKRWVSLRARLSIELGANPFNFRTLSSSSRCADEDARSFLLLLSSSVPLDAPLEPLAAAPFDDGPPPVSISRSRAATWSPTAAPPSLPAFSANRRALAASPSRSDLRAMFKHFVACSLFASIVASHPPRRLASLASLASDALSHTPLESLADHPFRFPILHTSNISSAFQTFREALGPSERFLKRKEEEEERRARERETKLRFELASRRRAGGLAGWRC